MRRARGRALAFSLAVMMVIGCGLGIAWAARGHRAPARAADPLALLTGRSHRKGLAMGLVARVSRSARHHGARHARHGTRHVHKRPRHHRRLGRHASVRARVTAATASDPTVSVGQLPTGVAVSSTKAYVANAKDNNVSVIDLTLSTPAVTDTISVGTFPDSVALSGDGSRLYVANFKGGTVSIASTSTDTVAHTVTVGSRPDGMVEAGGTLYVANLLSGTISEIDPSAGTVSGTITLPGTAAPSGLAASADGKTLYANDARGGKTYVVDVAASPPSVGNSAPVGTLPAYLSVAGTSGYVANPGSNSVSMLDLSTSTPSVSHTVTVGSHPYGVVALPSHGEAFATNSGDANMSVIDTSASTPAAVSTVATGTTPDAVAVSPDESTAVVSNEGDNTVSIFHVNDAPSNTVPGSQSVDANGSSSTHHQLTFSSAGSNQISTSDADAGSNPIAVQVSASHGTLTLSGTSGLTVSGNGTGSVSLSGTVTDVNTALDGLVYEPATGYVGSDSLSLQVDDQGSTGIGKAQTATSSVSIAVQNQAPTAGDVSYSGAVGNTTFGVGTTPSAPETHTSGTVLSNSSDNNGDTLSATSGAISTTNGGSVQMSSDGTFTYSPPRDFTGNDTFTFHVSDGHTTSSGTATVTVSGMVWYVNDNNASNGNGTSTSPYNTVSPFSTTGASNPSGSGETIFLYGSSTSYGGGITLKSSQTLVGQSQGLASVDIAASGSNPTVTNSSGTGITLAEGTTVAGITVDSTSGAGVSATSLNAFTLASSDSITNAGADALDVNGGSGTISNAAAISGAAGHSIVVQNRTGGTMTSSGSISDSATGISLTSNTGATINFTGAITASTGAHTAFTATGGGTIAATGSGSTLTTTTGDGVYVSGTTIASSGLTFQSVSVNGAANGIVLSSTGTSGGLSVTGTGAASSGGTIQSTTGDAINLSSTSNPSFNDLKIADPARDGVDGTSVHGFTYTNGTIFGAGLTKTATTDSALAFNNNSPASTNDNLDGAVTITGNTISNNYGSGVDILNFNGTISDANISSNAITSSPFTSNSKGTGIALNLFGNSTNTPNLTKAEIQSNTIANFPSGDGINLQGGNNTAASAPTGSYGTPGDPSRLVSITGNEAFGTHSGQCSGTTGCINAQAINVSITGKGQANVSVSSNGTNTHPLGENGGVTLATFFAGNVDATAAIENNIIASYNAGGAAGIAFDTGTWTLADSSVATGSSHTVKATITGNSVSHYGGIGIWVIQEDSNLTTDVKDDSNTTSSPESNNTSGSGMELDNGNNGSATYNATLCAEVKSNTAAASNPDSFGDVFPGIIVTKATSDTTYPFGIVGLTPTSSAHESDVESYVGGQNPSSAEGNVSIDSSPPGDRVLANPGDDWSSCTLPTMP